MSLANLKESINEKVADLATLEVATFTNNEGTELDLTKAVKEDSKEFTSNEVFRIIREGLTTSDLVGYSRFEIEGDTINYLNSDLGEGKKYLTDNHNTLVEGAQRTRKDLFEFVLKAIKDI